ncbi:MAG: ABC transporter substrate-binding protein [Deltaproteobacteria bacterium]|nr:ABC transporter substrate-binding protein [Deltaproteobacteria bacterium]
MLRFHFRFLFAILIACLMSLPGTAASGEAIKVGVLFHLSGDLAHFGNIQKNSFMVAFEELQKQFPDGVTIELIYLDMPTQPEKAISTMENLISQEGVSMVVGGLSSLVAWEVASIAQSHKVPFLMSAATEDRITEQSWEYVFRLNPPFSEYGNGLQWFLSEVVKPKTIAIVRSKGFTGMLSSARMIESCTKAGYEIVVDHIYDEKITDFRSVLKQINEKKPDVVAMASYLSDAVNIMRQCKELNVNPSIFVGLGGGFSLPQFGKEAGAAANYVYSISVWNPSVPYDGSKEFYETFLRRYHAQPNFHGADAYAAMQVVADVLRRSKNFSHEAIRDALAHTNMSSIIGPIKFVSYGKKTQQNRLPTYLVQWVDGKMKTVWPPRLACEKYIFPFPGWKEQ